MTDLLEEIARADEDQIETLLKAVISRYSELYPDWVVSTISIQKTGDKNEQLDNIIRLLQKMKHR